MTETPAEPPKPLADNGRALAIGGAIGILAFYALRLFDMVDYLSDSYFFQEVFFEYLFLPMSGAVVLLVGGITHRRPVAIGGLIGTGVLVLWEWQQTNYALDWFAYGKTPLLLAGLVVATIGVVRMRATIGPRPGAAWGSTPVPTMPQGPPQGPWEQQEPPLGWIAPPSPHAMGATPPAHRPTGASAFAPTDRTNTMAVLALIFGILTGLPGVVFGHIALSQISRTGERGRGMAITGLVFGYLWTAWTLVFLFFLMMVVSSL